MKETVRYFLNRGRKKVSEQIFEGISNGRKKALENWFQDQWMQVEVIKSMLASGTKDQFADTLMKSQEKSASFIEIFVTNADGVIITSSFSRHVGGSIHGFPNIAKASKGEKYMYGPYCDEKTLDLPTGKRRFYDEVTLLFSVPFEMGMERYILCARVLNDDMCNVIQEEDTHVYKDSGDNYLFMISNNRKIPQGMAISRSRFEDNTFTLGDNLKDGIQTKKWGKVKVEKHTELEIMFTDPATGQLHDGVRNTVEHGENLDCYPGYPDYRHILVGGKGTTIKPPYSDEVWGMMCEGDIADIYHYSSISCRTAMISGGLGIIGFLVKYVLRTLVGINEMIADLFFVVYLMLGIYWLCKKILILPINRVTNVLQDIAEGEGDLSRRVTLKSTDEVGQLARWFNKFVSNQMFTIRRVARSLKTSRQAVETVTMTNDNIQQNMKVIEQTVKVLSSNAMEQNELFKQTQNEVKNIADSFEKNQELHALVNTIRNKTKETNILADESNQMTKDTVQMNNELQESMNTAMTSIIALEERSREITDIVSTIQQISNQTSLLALNASIEAARAGDVGRGFAVVADEIKKLAEDTNQSTSRISGLVNAIQSEVNDTNDSIDQIQSKVERSIELSSQSIQGVSLIVDISKTIFNILDMIEEQSEMVEKAQKKMKGMEKENRENTQIGESKAQEAFELMDAINDKTEKLSKVIANLEYATNDLGNIVEAFTLNTENS